jgi:2-polyprenyl-3-methyl-5-hydroxy-6-metoxy-1,4-benzoquinol methylase
MLAMTRDVLRLGPMHEASLAGDPKHVGFVQRRYHFVRRMLQSTAAQTVLEIGCGDCSFASLVIEVVKEWRGVDIDPSVPNMGHRVYLHDFVNDGPLKREPGTFQSLVKFDAAYALDVLEHISPDDEDKFIANIAGALAQESGILIIGMPSLESQKYASALSKQHHVNCKTEEDLCATMRRHFHNVFLFGLNDYALHDGFGPMCHYRLAVCAGKR